MKLIIEDFTDAIDEYASALRLKPRTQEYSAFYAGVIDGEEQGSELSAGKTYENSDCQDAYDKGAHLGAAIRVAITEYT